MKEYDIIEDNTIEGMVRQVQHAMHQGWQPVGGVSTSTAMTGEERYAQAMAR